jgi:hypothetical protein
VGAPYVHANHILPRGRVRLVRLFSVRSFPTVRDLNLQLNLVSTSIFLFPFFCYNATKSIDLDLCNGTKLLPPFQNIRCFSFMKQMYLDIF